MYSRKLREDVPLNLGAKWKEEARDIRNRLLMFRFRNYGQLHIDSTTIDRSIEPRLAQVFGPLLSVVKVPSARRTFLEVARAYHQELVDDRGFDLEAQVLDVTRDAIAKSSGGQASMRDIAALFQSRYGDEYDRRITAKWLGTVIRRRLQVKTQKSHGVFVIAPGEKAKLERLYERYGIAKPAQVGNNYDDVSDIQSPRGEIGDVGDSAGSSTSLGL